MNDFAVGGTSSMWNAFRAQLPQLEADVDAMPDDGSGLKRQFLAMLKQLEQAEQPSHRHHAKREAMQEETPDQFPAPAAQLPVVYDPPPAGGQGTPVADSSVKSTQAGASTPPGLEHLTRNAGGVLQAPATEGVSPASVKLMSTGANPDRTYNVTNATSRTESFTYSDRTGAKMTMTLDPGQTGTFQAPSERVGVRISPSNPTGDTHPNEVLDEDGATIAPGADANAVQPQTLPTSNQDVSKVDGDEDFYGNHMNMTVTLSNGRTGGDGDPNHAYAFSTDDAASMDLAGDPSKTANIVMSDKTDIVPPTS